LQFTLCKGSKSTAAKDQCFASQRCTVETGCFGGVISTLGDQQPIRNACLPPLSGKEIVDSNGNQLLLCGTAPAQVRLFGFMGMMMLTIVVWIVACYALWKHKKQTRERPSRGGGGGGGGGSAGDRPNALLAKSQHDFYKEKSEKIFNHSTKIIEAYDRHERFQNATSVATGADVLDVVSLYRLLALGTINVTHGEGASGARVCV
jgi:hypothetical protein